MHRLVNQQKGVLVNREVVDPDIQLDINSGDRECIRVGYHT
jgi:hypothetical protein